MKFKPGRDERNWRASEDIRRGKMYPRARGCPIRRERPDDVDAGSTGHTVGG